MKICSKCGRSNPNDSNFCEYCGEQLEEVLNENASSEMTPCKVCGYPLGSEDSFCPECGTPKGAQSNKSYDGVERNAIQNYLLYFKRTFDFKGRSTKREYWDQFWINLLISFLFGFIMGILFAAFPTLENIITISDPLSVALGLEDPETYNLISDIIWPLINIIPGLSLSVRRMNDVGKSWGAIFIQLIPLVGTIIFIVWALKPSNYYKNENN